MVSCHDMKTGEIYVCQECGLELQVLKECNESEAAGEACGCRTDEGTCCDFSCCGQPLTKK